MPRRYATEIKRCENCGREFEGIARRKHCSNACKQHWYREGQLDKHLRSVLLPKS